jgi:signal transduction histidine kinase
MQPAEPGVARLVVGLLTAGLAALVGLLVQIFMNVYVNALGLVQRQNLRLAAAAREKDEFLAVAAHELRTPLAVLAAHAEEASALLAPPSDAGGRRAEEPTTRAGDRPAPIDREGRPSRTQREWEAAAAGMAVMSRHVDSLNRLVGQLLDLARLTGQRAALSRAPVRLDALARRVATALEPLAEPAGCRLVVEAPGPVTVVADELRIERVVTNLVDNALRHGCPGTVTITVSAPDGEASRHAIVEVMDAGRGGGETDPAAAGSTPLLIGAAKPQVTASGGLGLGLAIARAIAEAHGGTLTIVPGAGGGTVARLALPPDGPPDASAPAA